jgi:type II secretory pathway component PulC
MLNFKNTKKLLLMLLITPSVLLLILSSHSIMNKPDIKKINPIDLKDIDMLSSFSEDSKVYSDTAVTEDFNYKLIGIRAGETDSSVIVKKGNKEYVVALGERLEEIYELIEVTQNEAVFRNGKNVYKINNIIGK